MTDTILVVDRSTGSRIRMTQETFDAHLTSTPDGKICRYSAEKDQNCEGDSLETAKEKAAAAKK